MSPCPYPATITITPRAPPLGEMVDFGEFDKMIKISRKMDKSDSYNRFSSNISFFIHEFLQTKHFF